MLFSLFDAELDPVLDMVSELLAEVLFWCLCHGFLVIPWASLLTYLVSLKFLCFLGCLIPLLEAFTWFVNL